MTENLADDLLESAAEIAKFIGKTERQTQWLLEKGRIPAWKLGGKWHMRRSVFLQHVAQLEAAAGHGRPRIGASATVRQ